MWETLYSLSADRRFRLFIQVLVDLAGGDADSLQYVALAQQAERELLAHVLAVGGVVDALLLQASGSCDRGMPLRCATSVRAVFRVSSGTFNPAFVGALGLDLLQHQALQHLLAQHVLGRQLELLLPQALAHDGDLVIELTVQHHAVVHHGGDAVQQLALGGQLAGLGVR